MKILFLIRALNQGGAQRQLITTASALQKRGYNTSVCVFYAGGSLDDELRKTGVPLHSLEKKNRRDIIRFFISLLGYVKKERPDIIHSYLDVGNILSALIKIFMPKIRIIWGIRSSNMDMKQYDWLWRTAGFVEKHLAGLADLIIVNSKAGLDYSADHGLPRKKMIVISNGIDTERFIPAPEAGEKIRSEWNVQTDDILVGLVARMDPKKDHMTFLSAAGQVVRQCPGVKFVCVGRGEKAEQERLEKACSDKGLEGKVIWAGLRSDMPAVYNAFDILCLSSGFGEGFPNVIGEAMSCGVPCVATDVGDSAMIIGRAGIVVPPSNHKKLAAGIVEMVSRLKKNNDIVDHARTRILDLFTIDRMIIKTEEAISGL